MTVSSPEWKAAGEDLQSWGGRELVTMFSAAPHGPGTTEQ
jgi:hypothetical protein